MADMRERVAAILFVIILAFLGVFSVAVFHKLFIEPDERFSETASAAFLGAFLAFMFVRVGDFFKTYSDRTAKNHSALIKLEHVLNGLLTTLDDNIFLIKNFDTIYRAHTQPGNQGNVFVWANRLHPVAKLDELIFDLLNIDLINELFVLNVHLRKLNDSMDTLNAAYAESKDALVSGKIDPANYMANVARIHSDMLEMRNFLMASIEETIQALAAVRVLARNRPLMGYLLRRLAGHKYSNTFTSKRSTEVSRLRAEVEDTRKESGKRITTIRGRGDNPHS